MKGKGSGWKGESRRHSMARKGVNTSEMRDRHRLACIGQMPESFVAKGRVVHGYDIDEIYNGFVEAMLWSTREMGLKDDEEIYLDENYGIYDIDKDTEQAIKHLIEDFMEENYELFDEIQINDDIHISESQIGHDLLLTTQGHGVGFWDRGYGLNGEILTKESEKFFNDSMYAFSQDGKIYFEGMDLKNKKASGKKKRKGAFPSKNRDKEATLKVMGRKLGYRTHDLTESEIKFIFQTNNIRGIETRFIETMHEKRGGLQ